MNQAFEHKPLLDPFMRTIDYLRLSVTDRCNLRCTYCMAEDMEFMPKSQVLSLEEIEIVAHAFVELGITKIRLTGGEPLVRQGIVELARTLSAIPGLTELVMTSNGVLLDKYAKPLADAGIARINISLDSLREDRFHSMTRFGKLDDVIRGIESARKAGFRRIKINSVILSGVNDDEIIDLARFAVDRGLDISFIEEMPLGEITSHQRSATQIPSASIRDQLAEHFKLTATDETTGGPSRYMRVANSRSRIGFISPMSDNFCASCNRVRLTAEGRLLLCLGNEHSADLRAVTRENPGETRPVKDAIREAITRKPEKHHFDANSTEIIRFMSETGG